MRILNSRITINGRVLPFVQYVEVTDSRNTHTNTAKIQIQNRINERNQRITDLIAKGSVVIIELGYDGNYNEVFRGYVSQVIPEKTAVIQCEDEAYNVKRKSIGEDIIVEKTTLNGLFERFFEVSGDPFSAPISQGDGVFLLRGTIAGFELDIYIKNNNIGDWKVSKTATLIDVLAELKKKFRIYSYFRGKNLYVGSQADTRTKQTIRAHFQRNVPIGESSFNFKEAEADRTVVKATSILRNGTILTVFAFYDGTPATVTFSNTKPVSGNISEFNIGGQSEITEAQLRELAQIKLESISFTGCDGSIVTYGEPFATHGDICQVIDLDVPEKDNNFAIVEVVKRFGASIGYRQDLKLGIRL